MVQIGLKLGEDVTGVTISGHPNERINALRDGRVEAVAVSPPITFRAKKAGFRELVSLADLPGDYQSGSCTTSAGCRFTIFSRGPSSTASYAERQQAPQVMQSSAASKRAQACSSAPTNTRLDA